MDKMSRINSGESSGSGSISIQEYESLVSDSFDQKAGNDNQMNMNFNSKVTPSSPDTLQDPLIEDELQKAFKPRQRSFHRTQSSSGTAGTGNTKATGMTRRCACNLSQCASTNYMCKSEKRIDRNVDGSTTETDAGCFIEELNIGNKSQFGHGGVTEANGKVTSARRGCIEMLSREKLKLCSDRTGAPVHCCFNEDMCNYPKTFYPPQFHSPNINRVNYDSNNGVRGMPPPNLDQQVWLRAALICVPVCGLMILIVLIIVARRLLKNDGYKEATGISRMYQSPNNKSCNNYYYPPPPPPPLSEYPHIKPVFLPEYQEEYLMPVEIQQPCCCCHNNHQNNTSAEMDECVSLTSSMPSPDRGTRPIGRKISTATTTSETEELVTSTSTNTNCDPIICNCSTSGSLESFCNIRPPSIVFTGPPIPISESSSTAKRINSILSRLGFLKIKGNTRLSSV